MFWWRLALIAATGFRLWAAWRAPLSPDESYYWVWSRVPAWGYLDHPPMVAGWIRVGCAVAGDTALGVRLLAPVAALFGTLLLARAAEDLAPGRRAGLVAAVLFNATLVCNAGAVLMTPDTPLLFFWTAALAALARVWRSGNPSWWLAVGLASGLALDSKYTALLLGAGILFWLAAAQAARRWLRAWQFWAGGALALAVFAPVLWWNAAHGFASFAKQGGRAADWHPARAAGFLMELVGGQVGLATPLVAVCLGTGMVRAARGCWSREPVSCLLAGMALLPAALFLQHALGGRVQANWPAIIYPGAALAGACLGATPVRFWQPASYLGAAIGALVLVQAAAAPLVLPRALDATLIRLGGWQDLAGAVYAAKVRSGAGFVVADEYGLASELAFRLHGPVAGQEPRWGLFDGLAPAELAGRAGVLVRSRRAFGQPDPRPWAEMTAIGSFARARAGVAAETYDFYRVVGAPAVHGAVWLPSPRPPALRGG